VHPNVPGVPWWGAVMIAVTATAIGFAFDAGGGKELTQSCSRR
jgi:high-affinity Fe2+/Pb2+ permease